MRKHTTRLAVAAGAAALATVTLSGPAYADENRSGDAVTCAEGQAVEFSAVISDSFLSTTFSWVRTPGDVPRMFGELPPGMWTPGYATICCSVTVSRVRS